MIVSKVPVSRAEIAEGIVDFYRSEKSFKLAGDAVFERCARNN